jgi:RNA polymerase sigma-70 factor (ECF subfamily)
MNSEIGGIPEYVWEQTDNSQRADQHLLYKELIIQIKKLPPMYRTVFNMYVIDGCTHFEIADKLGISVGTSKSNLSRARAMMQKIIKGKEKAESGKALSATTHSRFSIKSLIIHAMHIFLI